jgi:predicted amidohydrolase
MQNYNQQISFQELNAKDLHGTEWKLRHIYWGVPSDFVYIEWVSLAWGLAICYTVLYIMLLRIPSANMGSIFLACYSGLSTEWDSIY